MKIRLIVALTMALMLVATMALPALADALGEFPKTATVTVNAISSATVIDNGAQGLDFGSLNPGTMKQAEAASPSITITAPLENNDAITISIKGIDFTGIGHTLTLGNAFWKTTNDSSTATAMTTDYGIVTTLNAGDSVSIYHWLSVPGGQAADTYTSTFTYKTE